ncbi:MAG: TIM barrel protein [Pirellulaceae bacterium]|nr:TIM barrel protein [Pirellulaceae bacterium]
MNTHLTSRRAFINRTAAGLATLGTYSCGNAANGESQKQRFPLSLHQFSLKNLFDDGRLDLLSYPRFVKNRLQISNLEFAAEFCSGLLDSPRQAEAIRRQSKQVGVTNRMVLCGDSTALDAANAKQRAMAITEHLRWAKVAEHLGCQYLRVRASTEGDRQQQLENAAAGVGGLCDALKSSKVSVLVENIAAWSSNPDWLVQLVKRIGEDRVGLVADFGNFDGNPYEGMKTILPHTKSICAKSWEFNDAGQETKIHYERMMKVIKQSKFRGCVAIEYLGDQPVIGIDRTAALIRQYGNG